MTDKIMAIVAYLVLLCFLGILLWHVPRLDLGGVLLFTLVLAGVDTAQVLRSHVSRDQAQQEGRQR
ncbi:hypothetical protein [Paracoccus salsus]|uniref:hypothetical protein n=1 Tax=Paracoccus salsus TaxID=2911061 RepID=UPI001F2FCF62|nr:hypothetical protein [Paracoccus salsus]MCF3972606.1 hypothetical protein [Paracoccus salsus]